MNRFAIFVIIFVAGAVSGFFFNQNWLIKEDIEKASFFDGNRVLLDDLILMQDGLREDGYAYQPLLYKQGDWVCGRVTLNLERDLSGAEKLSTVNDLFKTNEEKLTKLGFAVEQMRTFSKSFRKLSAFREIDKKHCVLKVAFYDGQADSSSVTTIVIDVAEN